MRLNNVHHEFYYYWRAFELPLISLQTLITVLSWSIRWVLLLLLALSRSYSPPLSGPVLHQEYALHWIQTILAALFLYLTIILQLGHISTVSRRNTWCCKSAGPILQGLGSCPAARNSHYITLLKRRSAEFALSYFIVAFQFNAIQCNY
jgi:hypothetical protein